MQTVKVNPEYTYEIEEVVRIVDGDSFFFRVVLKNQVEDYGFGVIEHVHKTLIRKFRLRYFDAPETYRPDSPEEKEKGIKAKQFVIDELKTAFYKEVVSFKDKIGMYGRYIAEIRYQKEEGGAFYDIGQELKKNGLLKEEK